MRKLIGLGCSIGLLASVAMPQQGFEGEVWFTGGIRGQVLGCGHCPVTEGAPSLARKVDERRGAAMPGAIWVDAGAFLVGPDTMASGGGSLVSALSAAGLGAAHVTTADLWFGVEETLGAFEKASFVRHSANLFAAGKEERLFAPFARLPLGDSFVAWVGVSAMPASPIAGVDVRDPIRNAQDGLAECLAMYGDGPVFLTYYGDAEDLKQWPADLLGAFRSVVVVEAPGAKATIDLPDSWAVVGDHSGDWLTWQAGKFQSHRVPKAGAEDPAVLAALEEEIQWDDLLDDAGTTEEEADRRSARNLGFKSTLMGHERKAEWHGVSAPQGMEFLVVTVEWENVMASELRQELDYLEQVQITFPTRQVLLLDGEGRLRRPLEVGENGQLGEPVKVHLNGTFAFTERTFAYVVPAQTDPVESPDDPRVRIFHEHFPALELPLGAGSPEPSPTKAPELIAGNSQFECGLGIVTSGPGTEPQTVVWSFDWIGRSHKSVEADALAFDLSADPEAKTPHGQPAEYMMAWELLTLVGEDGSLTYVQDTPLLDDTPVWLPDEWSRVPLRFVLPKGVKPHALRIPFTGIRTPGVAGIEIPDPILLPFKGAAAKLAPVAYLHAFEGTPLRGEYRGAQLLEGRLRLRLGLANTGELGGFADPEKRFAFAGIDGKALPVEFPGSGRLPSKGKIWLPGGGEVHPIEMDFVLPDGLSKGVLTFQGVDGAQSVGLDWSTGEVRLSAEAPVPGPGPIEPGTPAPSNSPELGSQRPENSDPGKPDPLESDPNVEGPASAPQPGTEVPSGDELPPLQGLGGVGLPAEAVNAAIDRGADFLWEHTKEILRGHTTHLGRTNPVHSLICLALVHAGLDERNEEFRRELHLAIPRMSGYMRSTYPASMLCMLIDAVDDPTYQPLLLEAAKALVEGQGPDGTWTYSLRRDSAEFEAQAKEEYVTVFGAESTTLEREDPWAAEPNNGDNSVTQFALMGLRAAQRQGLEVPQETWRRAEASILARQHDDGGLGYKTEKGYGSMTCAGVGSLAITRWGMGLDIDLDAPGIREGLGWLGREFAVDRNPYKSSYHYYYLYSLERVGRLLGTPRFGPHEWFPRGAKYLVQNQLESGGWAEKKNLVEPTSYALLFLTRATESLAREVVDADQGHLAIEVVDHPDPVVYWIVDSSGSMRSKLGDQSKLDWMKNTLGPLAETLPESTAIGLRAYGHRLRANKKEADRDSELLLPIGPCTAEHLARFREQVSGLAPRGKTPMAYSLEQAQRDFGEYRKGTVILLTDGGEDTRERRNPVEVAERFGKRRGWKLIVVGFDINKPRWTTQLEEMAAAAGGMYLPASDGAALLPILQAAVEPLPQEVTLVSKTGAPEQTLTLPGEWDLEPGPYELRFSVGLRDYSIPMQVNPGKLTRVRLDPSRFQPKAVR